jgi:nitrate reductase alpha subunit
MQYLCRHCQSCSLKDKGLPKIETDIDATEVILSLAPETNGQVAVKAWAALGKITSI